MTQENYSMDWSKMGPPEEAESCNQPDLESDGALAKHDQTILIANRLTDRTARPTSIS